MDVPSVIFGGRVRLTHILLMYLPALFPLGCILVVVWHRIHNRASAVRRVFHLLVVATASTGAVAVLCLAIGMSNLFIAAAAASAGTAEAQTIWLNVGYLLRTFAIVVCEIALACLALLAGHWVRSR
jgi:hypothetical protein